MQKKNMAHAGEGALPMKTANTIRKALTVAAHLRAVMTGMRILLMKNGDSTPPNMEPRSAARKGSHAKYPICFKFIFRSVAR